MKMIPRLTWIACVGVSTLWFSLLGGQGQSAQEPLSGRAAREKFLDSFRDAIRIQESEPVTVKDAEFVAVAQTNWRPGRKPVEPGPMVSRIALQFRIRNRSNKDLIFPTCQTFGIKLSCAAGEEVKATSVRKGDSHTRPILLAGGVSHTLCPHAELRRDQKTGMSELAFFDGSGAESVIGPLAPGRYKLVFWYAAPSPKKEEKQKDGNPAPWVGEAVTREVLVELGENPTKEVAPGPDFLPKDFAGPLRIVESKPVTVNGAKFVTAAQGEWRPAKAGQAVPIEIQLRITNTSKRDLLFPTFDTFYVTLADAQGKQFSPQGGRLLTRITRTVLIPAGASFSLAREGGRTVGRQAELYRDRDRRKLGFAYFDGTGMGIGFGLLDPGRYKVRFGYVVPCGKATEDELPANWTGQALTDVVTVEVLKD
jgi:hypothetical protein